LRIRSPVVTVTAKKYLAVPENGCELHIFSLDYAGFEKRTCEPCVPLIFMVTVLLPVPTFAGTAGKSLLLFTTEAVCPLGQW
jgi:hypothetical protein